MAITSSFANLATVTRASKKTDAGGWDLTNGGAVGTLTEYASNVAAIHATAGLLLEESSTNQIRNPRGEGAVAGTPGTAPTNWSVVANGTTASIVGSGTVNGWPYVDVRFAGTPTIEPYIFLEAGTYISAAQGEDWTFSVGCELVGGDLTNLLGFYLRQWERNSGGGFLSINSGATETPDASHRRFYTSAEIQSATAAYVVPALSLKWSSGAIDVTIRIYAPQSENKDHATSPVLPTASSPAASTRAADLVLFDLGSWFSSTAWTAFFSFKPATAGLTGKVVGGVGDTSDDAVYLDIGASSGTRASVIVKSGGSTSATLTPSGQSDYAIGDTLKVAIGAEVDNFAMSLNGATQATDTGGSMPVSNARLSLGNGPSSATANSTFCGYITDFRYFPRRLANAELEALVGN